MDSSLDHPDDAAWPTLPGYSEFVASRLKRAYARIARRPDRVASYLRAAMDVMPFLRLQMADPQRLRILYVGAQAYSADNQSSRAIEWIDTALELAIQITDYSAMASLLYLRGTESASLLHYDEAAADYQDCRALLHDLRKDEKELDAPFELHLVTREANVRFFLGQYEQTEHLLDEARGLVPFISGHQTEIAVIPWIEAHLFRWRGEPERALRPAIAAAEAYKASSSTSSILRIQTVTADVALDLAATFPPGSDRDAMLLMAESHLGLALQAADRGGDVHGGDENGVVLAQLTQIRYRRMRNDNTDRLGAIEWLARAARRLKDDALLAQAFTALGDELAAQGQRDAALSYYRQVLGMLDGSGVPALGVWAQRALYRANS